MSTVKIIAVAATLGGLGAAACATTAGSLSGQVWRMKIADDGRLVILDSAVVGEWRVCFWYDSRTLATRHLQVNPHCGFVSVTRDRAHFLADEASFEGFVVVFSRSTVPPCARTALPNEEHGTLTPDFSGSPLHLELPAFRYRTAESGYVIATGRVRGDSLVGEWVSADSTCSGSGRESFIMSMRR